MNLPVEGIFHNIVIISIDKRYPGHARKIMNAFWGLGQLMFSKTVIVVDKDVNVQNLSEVAWIVGTTSIRSATSSSCAARWTTSRTRRPAGLRRQDGDRRHAQVEVRRVHAAVADAHSHDRGGRTPCRSEDRHGCDSERAQGWRRHRRAISLDEAQAILADRNLIAVGARGDDERRRRHGRRTTFVRVFEVHIDAIPPALPASASAGEIRVTGEAAVGGVRRGVGHGGAGARRDDARQRLFARRSARPRRRLDGESHRSRRAARGAGLDDRRRRADRSAAGRRGGHSRRAGRRRAGPAADRSPARGRTTISLLRAARATSSRRSAACARSRRCRASAPSPSRPRGTTT